MATLTISATSDLGTLSLRVINTKGRLVQPEPQPLSSSRRQTVVTNLPEGPYIVIGTRPSGQTMTREVLVRSTGGRVDFSVEGQSPNEFMSEAMQRGLVPALSPEFAQQQHLIAAQSQMSAQIGASGDAGQALRAIGDLSIAFAPSRDLKTDTPVLGSALFKSISAFSSLPSAATGHYRLRRWTWRDGRWRRDTKTPGPWAPLATDWGAGYLRVQVMANSSRFTHAFALLDDKGYGPIVIAPPFRNGLNISFLADGLTAEGAAERVANPSAVRVPVAVALPANPIAADLWAA